MRKSISLSIFILGSLFLSFISIPSFASSSVLSKEVIVNQEITKSKQKKTVQGKISSLSLSIRQLTNKQLKAKRLGNTGESLIYAESITSLKDSLQKVKQALVVTDNNTVTNNVKEDSENLAMKSRIFNDYYSPALAKCWTQDEFLNAIVTKHNIQENTPEYTYAKSLSFAIPGMDQQACKDINAIDEIREMTISINGGDSVDTFLKKISDKYGTSGAPYKYATDWIGNKNYENPRYTTSNGYFVDTWYDKDGRYNPPQAYRGAILFSNRTQTGLKGLAQTQSSIQGDVITTYNNFIEFGGTKQQFLDEILDKDYFVGLYGYEFAQTLSFPSDEIQHKKMQEYKAKEQAQKLVDEKYRSVYLANIQKGKSGARKLFLAEIKKLYGDNSYAYQYADSASK